MDQTILIFAYYPYYDPIFQSAVLPYFINLKKKDNLKFVLLTFEHDGHPLLESEIGPIESFLHKHDIIWERSTWRSGRFKLVKKVLDFFSSIFRSLRIIRQFKIKTIYTEGFPGAVLSYYISVISGCKHIVHTFEPLDEYMVDAGVWKSTSWEAKFHHWHEMKIARNADCIMTGTRFMIERLKEEGVSDKILHRVPSCVDTNHFRFNANDRNRIRALFNISEREPVLVYLGKFGGMYMEDEAFEFFRLCQQELNAWIMVLTTEPEQRIRDLVLSSGVSENRFISRKLTRPEVPAYLSAADIGFVAVRQWPSKVYCSPIKTGEYLSCGLPVIVPLGISDDPEILAQKGIGILMKTVEKSAFQEVISEWETWINTRNSDEIRQLARKYALEDRSIEKYQSLYTSVFESL